MLNVYIQTRQTLKRVVKGSSATCKLAIFSPLKRENKNLIHVNRDQGHFRDS